MADAIVSAKTCRKCGVPFIGRRCKACQKARRAVWSVGYYARNKENICAQNEQWRAANIERVRERSRERHAANPEPRKQQKKERYDANPEKERQKSREWYRANLEKARVIGRANTNRWRKANPALANAASARKRAWKLKAVPSWANTFFMAEAYDLAKLRTKATGIEWNVDHCVPLKSRLVCGLHVENNLQVITWAENMVKGNRYWLDMP